MAEIVVGKLLPNLKITLGSEELEGENSEKRCYESFEKHLPDANENKDVEIVRSWMKSLQKPKIYKNKSGGFSTGLDLTSEDNLEVLGKRAERFGLEKEESSCAHDIISLYENMGISHGNKHSAKMKTIRLDALHMRGVNELSTNEIFYYFKEYGPASVEWINDFSCNVVWLDEISCARALLGVSKPLSDSKVSFNEDLVQSDSSEQDKTIQIHSSSASELSDAKDEINMDTDLDICVKPHSQETSVSLDIPIPPGYWRLGKPHLRAKTILLRFATKEDKKLPGAEKRSNYYKKYGNPNYGGLKGLISSSRKRKMQAAINKQAVELGSTQRSMLETSLHSANPKRNVRPRMRMYADDEEMKFRKLQSSNLFTEKQKSVHNRLGNKYTQEDLCHLGTYYQRQERNFSVMEGNDILQSFSSNDKWNNKRKAPPQDLSDLRTKLKRLRNESVVSKHRSPLCVDESGI